MLGYVRKISSQKKMKVRNSVKYKLRHCRWLIVDATLEASGAPVHELDGALGLDGCHCCIHIFWHHISWATERSRGNPWAPKNLFIGLVHPIHMWKHRFLWLVLKNLGDGTWANALRIKNTMGVFFRTRGLWPAASRSPGVSNDYLPQFLDL